MLPTKRSVQISTAAEGKRGKATLSTLLFFIQAQFGNFFVCLCVLFQYYLILHKTNNIYIYIYIYIKECKIPLLFFTSLPHLLPPTFSAGQQNPTKFLAVLQDRAQQALLGTCLRFIRPGLERRGRTEETKKNYRFGRAKRRD